MDISFKNAPPISYCGWFIISVISLTSSLVSAVFVFHAPHATFFPFGWLKEWMKFGYHWKCICFLRLSSLEAVSSRDDDDWVTANDGSSTSVKWSITVLNHTLPWQLVFCSFFSPNNPHSCCPTSWKKEKNRINKKY